MPEFTVVVRKEVAITLTVNEKTKAIAKQRAMQKSAEYSIEYWADVDGSLLCDERDIVES